MSLSTQAKSLLEQGASVTQVARELGLEESAVASLLGEQDDISDEDFNEIRSGLIELAKHSENEIVRARVGMFLWEQKRGIAKAKMPTVNIIALNNAIKNASERARAIVEGKIVDIVGSE